MRYADWARRRVSLNHDWLQNRYLTFLDAHKENLDCSSYRYPEDDGFLQQLFQWRTKRGSFEELLENALDAFSPRQLVDEPPLLNMREEDRKWLGEVIHTLYLERSAMQERVEKSKRLLKEVDKVIGVAETMVQTGVVEHSINSDLVINAIKDFSKAISELPHEIQLP